MHLIRVALITIVDCGSSAYAQQPSTPPTTAPAASVTDETFDAALEKAAAAKPGSEPFVAALQSVAGRFTAVDPATQPASGAFRDVQLNARGKKVDAVRFRVPQGERRDLFWALAFPKNLGSWYIAPAEGPAGKGFTSFQKTTPSRLFKGPPPAGLTGGVLQALAGEHLEPGREYLIWFLFKDETPATVSLAMALLPSKGDPEDTDAVKALGLPLPPAAQPAPAAAQ